MGTHELALVCVYFNCIVLPHFYSFLWQVSHLYRCSPWYWWCPLHVLPLLYLCPDRKMSCSDYPALQTPYCGVDELYHYISCSQKGDSKQQPPVFFWDMSSNLILCFSLTSITSILISVPKRFLFPSREYITRLKWWDSS